MAKDPRPAHGGAFVPDEFMPPPPPRTESFWLEPLDPEHNVADYEAWTTSIDHIRATPGFPDSDWPHPMSLDDNFGDLQMHADHFTRRLGFTYTVRSTADDDVIGCVYIYPSRDVEKDADVKSWVRVSHATLDVPLWSTVSEWLSSQWPFREGRVDYAPRQMDQT
jgi:hypothetical protein